MALDRLARTGLASSADLEYLPYEIDEQVRILLSAQVCAGYVLHSVSTVSIAAGFQHNVLVTVVVERQQ